MNMAELIDEMMGFNPQDMSIFADKGPKSDPNIYRTNPKDSISEDGNYHSVVKLILNPFSPKDSIIPRSSYWLESLDGNRLVVSSLTIGDKNCPLFKCWKRGHFSGDETYKNSVDSIFDKTESRWVLVQVLEDENQPGAVGKFKMMKLAKDIYAKLEKLMNPSNSTVGSYPVMDYVVGLQLVMDVKPGPDDPQNPGRKQREISYSLCEFKEYAPIIKTDGTPLFTEEELELIDEYVQAAKDSKNGKTQKKKDEATAKLEVVKPQIKPLYQKAIEYVMNNMLKEDGTKLDILAEQGYAPWDEQTEQFVSRYCEMIDARINPKTMSYALFSSQKNNVVNSGTEPVPQAEPSVQVPADNDLPF